MKGIRRQRRGERIVRYHRATGIRLPDDIPETHPDFIAAWAQAEATAASLPEKARRGKPVLPGSVAAAFRAMQATAWWRGLSPSYRHALKRDGDDIVRLYGDIRAAIIGPAHIEADLAKFDPNPANHRLKAWRRIMEAAKVTPSPALAVPKREVRVDGFAPWSPDELAAFRARWPIGTTARAAFELVYWTAARTNDAVKLSRVHIGADGILAFRQSKTDGMAYVPWTNPLPDWAEGWAAERETVHAALERLAGGFTFLEAQGRARSVKGLGNLIANAARDAGLKDRTAHGLRKARLTTIAEAGGSAHAIMAWGGHKTLAEVQHYTLAAQMKRLISGPERIGNDVPLSRAKVYQSKE